MPPLVAKITSAYYTTAYDISVSLYALAAMDCADTRTFDALLATARGLASRVTHTDIAQIVWACGKIRYMGSRACLGELVTNYVTSVAAFQSRELTMLLWGMAKV